ncbi:MAG: GNAT family N-acetyltransferase [Steroidobacteraceae bacterium]
MNQLLHIPSHSGVDMLYGMLDCPAGEQGSWPLACILLSPGVKPRVAPHRLYRKLSGEFVRRNIPVLRLDFAGMGDSQGVYDAKLLADVYTQVQAGQHIADVRAAMDYMAQRFGIGKFLVGGLCGAAITGLLTAERDSRIAGLFSIGMPVVLVGTESAAVRPPTAALLTANREIFRRKAMNPLHWVRLLTLQSDYGLLWSVMRESLKRGFQKAAVWRKDTPPENQTGQEPAMPDFLDRNFVRAIFKLANSGRAALLLFGGTDRYFSEYQEYFAVPWAGQIAAVGDRIELQVVPEANHVLGEPRWIEKAKLAVGDWLDRIVLPAPASSAKQTKSLRTEVITNFERFLQLRNQWTEMLGRSSSNSVTLTWEWLTTWWRVYGTDRQLCVVALWSEGRLVGAAPLLRRKRLALAASIVPVRRIELLASGEAPGHQVCSDYIGWIAEAGTETQVVNAVLDALVAGHCGTWDELLLPDMQLATPMVAALLEACRLRGLDYEILDREACPLISLPAKWDAYMEGLGSSHRYRVRRALREFEAAGGKYHVAQHADELAGMQATLMSLHQTRWTARGEPGAFGSSLRRSFHQQFMPLALAKGWLRLGVLRIGDQSIGAIYNLNYANRIFFYQSGILPQDSNALRPGVLLHANEIAAAIDAGCHEYDFLKRGESQYKDSWANGSSELGLVRVAKPGLSNRLTKGARRARMRLAVIKRAVIRKKDGQ